jgi:hypothetical protein
MGIDKSPMVNEVTGERRKLIIFTEPRDTLEYLTGNIRQRIGKQEAVLVIHGGVPRAMTTAAIPAVRPTARRCKRALTDIRDRRIDVVVVYKVDRLTRSLADFAKLVELLDQHFRLVRVGDPAVQYQRCFARSSPVTAYLLRRASRSASPMSRKAFHPMTTEGGRRTGSTL